MEMAESVRGVVELLITPLDQYYYVSRESQGTESQGTFSTKPYIMHTALYYALGFLPTRFRVAKQCPRYREHFERSTYTDGVYIHPARVVGEDTYETRRFSVKGDAYRTKPTEENKNLLETGHQRTIEPDVVFRTFAVCRNEADPHTVAGRIDSYVRIGKKMAPARVQTTVHDVTIRDGQFELRQPVGRTDLNTSEYGFVGNLQMESMAPVDLITACDLEGPHVRVEPSFGGRQEEVALPANGRFIGIGR